MLLGVIDDLLEWPLGDFLMTCKERSLDELLALAASRLCRMIFEGVLRLVGLALLFEEVVEDEVALTRRGGSNGGFEALRGGNGGGGWSGWLTSRRRNGLLEATAPGANDELAARSFGCGNDVRRDMDGSGLARLSGRG
jgi:hypothetical protein